MKYLVPFTNKVALKSLRDVLRKAEKDTERLARELCLASDDPKPNRSLTGQERELYRRQAVVALDFAARLYANQSK